MRVVYSVESYYKNLIVENKFILLKLTFKKGSKGIKINPLLQANGGINLII